MVVGWRPDARASFEELPSAAREFIVDRQVVYRFCGGNQVMRNLFHRHRRQRPLSSRDSARRESIGCADRADAADKIQSRTAGYWRS